MKGKEDIMAQQQLIILNQDVKTQKQCIWFQNLKLGKGVAHTAETGLHLETIDSNQPPEADLNQEGVIMNQDQGMIDSKLQREEKSQTIVIDLAHPQDH